jgi:hypothetical protein
MVGHTYIYRGGGEGGIVWTVKKTGFFVSNLESTPSLFAREKKQNIVFIKPPHNKGSK